MKPNNIDPVESFGSFYHVFNDAEKSTAESQQLYFKIAGYEVELRLANSALVPYITPGLEHLKTHPKSSAAFTICAWDSLSTGKQMPPPPWTQDEYDARGEVRGFYDNRIYAAFHLDANILSMLDVQRNIGLFWLRDATSFPSNLRAVPFRPIFHWWMREKGLLFVHAASAGIEGGGALFVGKGGSGKSSCALASSMSGMLYLGDDHVLIEPNPDPHVFSLYSSARMDTLLLEKIKKKSPLFHDIQIAAEDKALVFLNQIIPAQLVPGLPLRAVIVPQIAARTQSSIDAISPITALRALAPSTIFMLSGAGKKDLSEMVKIVQQVPCYSLQIGGDLWDVPDLIRQVL